MEAVYYLVIVQRRRDHNKCLILMAVRCIVRLIKRSYTHEGGIILAIPYQYKDIGNLQCMVLGSYTLLILGTHVHVVL